jgi:hypothetical protein
MKTKSTYYFAAGFLVLLMGTTCLAAGTKKEAVRIAAVEQPSAAPQVLYEKPTAVLGEKEKVDREMIAMGRRIEEEASKGVPVETSLKMGISLPKTCTALDACPLTLTVENKGSIPVVSPILGAVTLGTSGGVGATTKTTGWTCGSADPKLTCASTGIALQPGEKSSFTIDWTPPQVTAKQTTKICANLVWPGRPSDGVYRADQIAAVQFALTRAGFETGGIDGRIRPKTLQAIRLLRQVANIPGPPQITPDLLNNLFGDIGKLSYDANTADDQACGELELIPAEKKPEAKVVASVTPAPEVKAPEPVVKTVTPPAAPAAPAPKAEEKKEAPKAAAPVQAEKKPEEAKPAPVIVATPAPKVETKTTPAAPKVETKPAAPAPKMETKPVAPAPKAEASKPAAPVAKVEDRFAPPKSNTAAPVVALPAETKQPSYESELVVISTERGSELFYRRGAEERGKPDYYVVDRGEGAPQKVASLEACDCKPVAAKASAPHKHSARKASNKGKKVAAYIPTAREFLNGWPNIVASPKF